MNKIKIRIYVASMICLFITIGFIATRQDSLAQIFALLFIGCAIIEK